MSTLRFNTWQDAGGTEVANSTLGTGKILQVVTATQSTPVSTTSTSFVTANLSATITPSSATSKVLVVCQFTLRNYITSGSGGNTASSAQIDRGGTSLTITGLERAGASAAGTSLFVPMSLVYLDSPATTSATTYNTTIRSDNAGYTTIAHPNTTILGTSETHTGNIVLLEVSA